MLDAIAERYFKINCAVFTPNDQRMEDIVQMAKDLHADGIVDVALQFCTLYEMESFAVEKAAEEAGIPFMHITTDYAGEDAGQLQTRIEAFLETISAAPALSCAAGCSYPRDRDFSAAMPVGVRMHRRAPIGFA